MPKDDYEMRHSLLHLSYQILRDNEFLKSEDEVSNYRKKVED